jgi:hypothetical protein
MLAMKRKDRSISQLEEIRNFAKLEKEFMKELLSKIKKSKTKGKQK